MRGDAPALELSGIVKDYKGLRPLRIASLAIARGERIALAGIDRQAAEALVNLLTGAALPDAGEVRIFGRSTAEIGTGDEWLASLDRFGIVTERAATLEGATIAQNLALSFTLSIDPVPSDVMPKIDALARDVGLGSAALQARPAEAPPETRMRVHLARALALDPAILLMEHPTASLPAGAAAAFADAVARTAGARGVTLVAITEDAAFARRAAARYLRVIAATGELAPVRRRWWF